MEVLTLAMKRNEYLDALEIFQIEPNFWCSEEYFEKAGWNVRKLLGCVGVFDEEGNAMLPVISDSGRILCPERGVWAGLPQADYPGDFLDYNFIYSPESFQDLSGGQRQTSRKNSRKFVNRNPDKTFQYISADDNRDDLTNILIEWLSEKERLIQDDEALLKYVEGGKNRKVLVGSDWEIYGLNIWDENYRYINFRYCFCKPGQFLSEYMRLLFYTDADILGRNKMVNDGGCLDNDELFRFKMKLAPIQVNKIYSWD